MLASPPPDPNPTEPVATRHIVDVSPRTLVLIVGVVAAIWITRQLTEVITVLTVALVLVGTFDPVVAWLERRSLGRGKSLVIVFVIAALLLAALVLAMVPPLISQVLHLVESAPATRDHVLKSIEGKSWAAPFQSMIKDLPLDDLAANSGRRMIGYSTKLFELLGYGISTLFLAIYLLADPVRAKGMVYAVVPRRHHIKLARILIELKVIVGGYMRGQLITSLVIAVFVFVLLTALGADNALPIALFAGITDIIPFVGGYIASAPVVIAVIPNGTTTVVVVSLLMVVYQEFESRILIPRVYGRVLRLPPAIVLVALLLGGTLAGLLGALLALPIAAGIQMLMLELRVDLPGSEPRSSAVLARDVRASEVYAELAEGESAADAGVIADQLASNVKERETRRELEKSHE